MYPCQVAGVQYTYRPPHFDVASTDFPSFDFSNIFAPPSQAQDMMMTIPRACEVAFVGSSNPTCDQSKQRGAGDERRKQRMISNRESARRSRMRKRGQLDEMQSQVAGLHAANQRLLDDLSRIVRDRDLVLHENAKLWEEETELRKKLDKIEGADELGGTC